MLKLLYKQPRVYNPDSFICCMEGGKKLPSVAGLLILNSFQQNTFQKRWGALRSSLRQLRCATKRPAQLRLRALRLRADPSGAPLEPRPAARSRCCPQPPAGPRRPAEAARRPEQRSRRGGAAPEPAATVRSAASGNGTLPVPLPLRRAPPSPLRSPPLRPPQPQRGPGRRGGGERRAAEAADPPAQSHSPPSPRTPATPQRHRLPRSPRRRAPGSATPRGGHWLRGAVTQRTHPAGVAVGFPDRERGETIPSDEELQLPACSARGRFPAAVRSGPRGACREW